jgi:hypothetical protein
MRLNWLERLKYIDSKLNNLVLYSSHHRVKRINADLLCRLVCALNQLDQDGYKLRGKRFKLILDMKHDLDQRLNQSRRGSELASVL